MKTDNARNLLLIITVVLIEFSSEENKGDETDEESLEDELDRFKIEEDGPINMKGKLRIHFAMNTALLNPRDNVICSPEAALFPLAHLALGAQGSCLKQILQAIGLASKTQIKKSFVPLIQKLQDIHGVTLTVISKIFISDEIKLKKKFVDKLKTVFKSTVSKVNFTSPSQVVNNINKYIRSITGGRIAELLRPDDVQLNSSMLLINVVCFTGDWKYHFTHAKVAEFNSPTQGPKSTVMLTREGFYKYYYSKQLNAKFIEIPYRGDQASLVIILPNPDFPLEGLLEELWHMPDQVQHAIEKMVSQDMILSIPKFRIEAHLDLKHSFTELGVKQIFKANKSGLDWIAKNKKQKIHVSLAVQRALFVFDDHGWEQRLKGGYQERPVTDMDPTLTIDVNYPFLFFVKFLKEELMAGVFAVVDEM